MKICINIRRQLVLDRIRDLVRNINIHSKCNVYEHYNLEYDELSYDDLQKIKNVFTMLDNKKKIFRKTVNAVSISCISDNNLVQHIIGTRLMLASHITKLNNYELQAKNYFTSAIKLGNLDSQVSLGMIEYTEKNHYMALNYWVRALSCGNFRAAYCLADYYKNIMMGQVFLNVVVFSRTNSEAENNEIHKSILKYGAALEHLITRVGDICGSNTNIYNNFVNKVLCDTGEAYENCADHEAAVNNYLLAIDKFSCAGIERYNNLCKNIGEVSMLILLYRTTLKSKFIEDEKKFIINTNRQLSSVRKQMLKKKLKIDECTICYETKPIILTKCKHIFCIDCYLRGCINRCAMCRYKN